jgi:regulator of chromosome condensation
MFSALTLRFRSDAKPAAGKATKTAKADTTTKSTKSKDTTKSAPTKVTKKTSSKAAAPAKASSTTKTASKATSKSTSKTKTTKSAPATEAKATTTSKKRKATEEPEEKSKDEKRVKKEAAPRKTAPKKAPTAKAAPKPVEKPAPKKGPIINEVPTKVLDIYVCGDGENAELGLGSEKNSVNVKRPRLNARLAADNVGIVDIAVGGMHCLALSKDNKIYTWGVNDQGALGRDTEWKAPEKEMDGSGSDSDSDGSNAGENLNPKESVPTAIPSDTFPEGTVFVKVAAGDSSSWALTDDGHLYGWGTFRVSLVSYPCISLLANSLAVQRRHYWLPKRRIRPACACPGS